MRRKMILLERTADPFFCGKDARLQMVSVLQNESVLHNTQIKEAEGMVMFNSQNSVFHKAQQG